MIQSGKITQPLKMVIYGTEGIGKSQFASQFPAPIFIDTENRTGHLAIDRIIARDYETFRRALGWVENDTNVKTLVIDTLDWLERIVGTAIVEEAGKTSIEDFGYGKGYKKIAEEIQKLVSRFEIMQQEKGMNLIFVAHSKMKRFDCPITGQSYDRYMLNCSESIAEQIKQWCDHVFFINWEDNVYKDETKKTRATGGRIRMCYTERCAAYDAKNSWQLPQSFALDYATIAPHIGEYTPVVSEAKQKKALREKVLEIAEPMGGADYIKKELTGRKFMDLTLEQCQEFLETIEQQAADFAALKENK